MHILIYLFRNYIQKIYGEEIVATMLSDELSDYIFLQFLMLCIF